MDRTQRREELLRAARDVFVTRGYHDAKVDDIVAAASVAKGTFYLYFPDKRSVFEELVDGMLQRLGAAVIHVDIAQDIELQVRHNIEAVLGVFLDDPAVTRILFSYGAGLDPSFVEKVRGFYAGAFELLREALAEGQGLGIVAPGDARLYSQFAIGGLKELVIQAVNDEEPPPRNALVEVVFGLLQRGCLRIPHLD